MAIADSHGLPVAIFIESASPPEVTPVQKTAAHMLIPDAPEHLIGDYDSDRLDETLASCGTNMVAPNRQNRKHFTQDRRHLTRYRWRWKIERLFAWFQNFRRPVTRYERNAENFLGMLHLGCALILLRRL